MEGEPVYLPQPWGVVYAKPNPDGSRKSCHNCMMWITGEQGCSIHDPKIRVNGQMVCSYHVFGEPMMDRMPHPGIDYVTPELSGLEEVIGGTSCDRCRYFESDSRKYGFCFAVADETGYTPVQVEPLGCCARWESIRED